MKKRAYRGLRDWIVRALLALYVFVLFKIILFKFGPIDPAFLRRQLKASLEHPGLIYRRLHEGNLEPFREITRTVHALSTTGLINLVGNIALFIPYGMLLGWLYGGKKLSLAGAMLQSFGLSLVLEGAQAVFSLGKFDVDDLILNSVGGLIGCIVFKIAAYLTTSSPSALQADNRPA